MNPTQLKQAIEEFKQIYFEEFGIVLTDQEATLKAISLLQLFDALTSSK